MKKHFTKIICAAVAAVVATGVAAAAGCSGFNSGVKLNYTPSASAAQSNGGFAVEKGGYVYFVNGVESGTAANDYGKPVKGSIMRIAVEDLNKRNYSSAETLVPQIAYSTNYSTGIFVYGDYIYYGTPSTKRNADGVIQSGNLEMKSTKLDGTESMKDAYVTFPSVNYDYRFVEVDGVVYLMYVATSETLYEESTGVTNLHSYNTKTGVDTLLAYNVSSYVFDAEDKSNPKVYYTMDVYDYAGTSNTTQSYNQVYSVTADKTAQNEYDFDSIFGWDSESDRYINCGDLVFDGFGGKIIEKSPFNYKPEDPAVQNTLAYKYTLETYRQGSLFYTRADTISETSYLFSVKDSDISAGAGGAWKNPIDGNPANEAALMLGGANADSYQYVFENGDLSAVLIAESTGGVSVNKIENGKLTESDKMNKTSYYRVVPKDTATMLFVDGDYLYYSVTGGNGYSFYRVNYNGVWDDYNGMHGSSEVTDYKSVRILDLDAASSWYMPELIDGHLIFASATDNMNSYKYVMTFNVGDKTNKDLDDLNKLYQKVTGTDGVIAGYESTDDYPADIYANLAQASRYIFYTGDIDYVKDLAALLNSKLDADADPVYSANVIEKLEDMLSCKNDWAEFKDHKATINGKEVYANSRDYYYSVIGKMSSADEDSYLKDFRSDYLQAEPAEEDVSWFQSLSTVAKVFFIIGMCLAGIIVIGAVIAVVLILSRKRGEKKPEASRRRIKVDTTDDKNINVYEDDDAESAGSEEKHD